MRYRLTVHSILLHHMHKSDHNCSFYVRVRRRHILQIFGVNFLIYGFFIGKGL